MIRSIFHSRAHPFSRRARPAWFAFGVPLVGGSSADQCSRTRTQPRHTGLPRTADQWHPIRLIAGLSLIALTAANSLAAPDSAPPRDIAILRAEPRLESDRLEPAQQRELAALLTDLRDAAAPAERRRLAAAGLLDRAWPPAIAALRETLTSSEDPAAVRAIAQALAESPTPTPQLIAPLLTRLGVEDASLRNDVAAALGRYSEPGLLEHLTELAAARDGKLDLRLGAIRALAGQRTKPVARTLLDLARNAPQPVIRKAALDSLARLTGDDDRGQDLEAWTRWFAAAEKLSHAAWNSEIECNVAAHENKLNRQVQALTARVTAAHTQVYDAAAEAARPAILLQMLADTMPEVRLLAAKLIERRILNAQPVTDDVKLALRQKLSDESAEMRVASAKLLADLADAPAAVRAAQLVTVESDTAAAVAQLGLLARLPSQPAIEPALRLMERSDLYAAAAAVIVAAFDANLLSADQIDRTLGRVKAHISAESKLDPMSLRLIARIGGEADQELVLRALGNSDAPLRLAAAEAFATDRRPIEPLLLYLTDPALRSVATQTIAKRGKDAPTLIKLLEAHPKQADQQPEWHAAVLAVAARLGASDLAAVDQYLQRYSDQRDVEEDILKVAAGISVASSPANPQPLTPSPAAPDDRAAELCRVEAQLRLADLYLRQAEPAKAKAVHARLLQRSPIVDESQRRRLFVARLQRMLMQQSVDEAAAYTQLLLAGPKPGDEVRRIPAGAPAPYIPPAEAVPPGLVIADIATPWFTAIESALDGKHPALASDMARACESCLTAKLDSDNRQRLTDLIKRLPPAPAKPSDEVPRIPAGSPVPAAAPAPDDSPAPPPTAAKNVQGN